MLVKAARAIVVASALFMTQCVSAQRAPAPLLPGCIGECGSTYRAQVVIEPQGLSKGCSTQCALVLDVVEGNLCPSHSMNIEVRNGNKVEYSGVFNAETNRWPDSILIPTVLETGDLVVASADLVESSTGTICKTLGSVNFEISLWVPF